MMKNEQKAKMIADQCLPCSKDFYQGIYQGVLLTLNSERKSICLISEERQRQVEEEGYTEDHDASHGDRSLVRAASCYALGTRTFERTFGNEDNRVTLYFDMWPWNNESWKPTPDDRVKELVKSGALIAAEIDRLLTFKN